MPTYKQPLAEVFGHLVTDHGKKATRYRTHRLCPFNNKVPSCTKDKAKNPLGVCSIYHDDHPVITCPVRFREDWLIAGDAASFFFDESATWSSLTEVRLNDAYGKSAGNIDVVLVAYDEQGKVYDFGALEIQAVYISGNVCDPFEHDLKDPKGRARMDWSNEINYPRPDYLSSQKRLASQILFRSEILHRWGKKIAVALNRACFNMLPRLHEVSKGEADIAWMVYEVVPGVTQNSQARQQMQLVMHKVVYSKWPDFLDSTKRISGEDISTFSMRIDTMLGDLAV